jgi:hypothetical protein
MTPEGGPEPKFWQIPLADLEQRLGADRNGLSSAEVAARRLPLQTISFRANALNSRGIVGAGNPGRFAAIRTDGHRWRGEISSWIAAWVIRSPGQRRPRRRTCLSPGRIQAIFVPEK